MHHNVCQCSLQNHSSLGILHVSRQREWCKGSEPYSCTLRAQTCICWQLPWLDVFIDHSTTSIFHRQWLLYCDSDKQLHGLMQSIDECGYFDHQQELDEKEEEVFLVIIFLAVVSVHTCSPACTSLSRCAALPRPWLLMVLRYTGFWVHVQQVPLCW